jgi:indolepyruvate ferredoxin oxidoreductase alpha subunit
VHVETNANEAGAAAMLGASINYPMRGAVAFKSTVGTNVASDALSNLASAGVKGGSLPSFSATGVSLMGVLGLPTTG